jgi:hypothetical protein
MKPDDLAVDWAAMNIALMTELAKRTQERDSLRIALKDIYDLYPDINCVCGRGYPRMSEERRAIVKQLIEGSY